MCRWKGKARAKIPDLWELAVWVGKQNTGVSEGRVGRVGPACQRVVSKEQVSSGGRVRTHREIQPTVGTVALN